MAVVRQKEPSAATARTVTSRSTGSVRCEVDTNGHTIVTDEAEARGGANTGASPLMHLTASLESYPAKWDHLTGIILPRG